MNKNYYNILEVSEDATHSDIKSSYRKLAKKYHPDKNKEDKSYEEKFKEVAEAYDTLGDSKKRKMYDDSRRNPFEKRGFGGFGGNHSGFGFDDFIKNTFNRNEKPPDTRKLNIRVKASVDIKDLLHENEVKVSFNRTLMDKSIENKDIKFKIDLRNRKYDIRKISNYYAIVLNISGMGHEEKGVRQSPWGNSEEYYSIGNLMVEIQITSESDFKIEEGNITEDIHIDLHTALFSKEKDYIVNSILGKKYRIDITNPKNLSSLKFTVKGNGIINNSNRLGDYVANLIVNAPNLEKLSDTDRGVLEELLSKGIG